MRRDIAFLLAFASLTATPLERSLAQAPCAAALRAPIPAGEYPWCATDSTPRLLEPPGGAALLRYPDMLRSANVEGEVSVELTITDSGNVAMGSLRFVQSTHDLFTNAVKSALSGWRFTPGMIGSETVRARGLVHAVFVIPHGDSLPVVAVTETPRATANGVEVRIGWRVPPHTMVQEPLDTARVYSLVEQIVREFGSTDTLRARCLEWSQGGRGNEPPEGLIAFLRRRGVPRLPASKCPPTHASMVVYVDSDGKPITQPPHPPDPHVLNITDLRPWTNDIYLFTYFEGVGTGARSATCQATLRAADGQWDLYCPRIRYLVY
jgi:TonB family protein